jgi:hypothetical protein
MPAWKNLSGFAIAEPLSKKLPIRRLARSLQKLESQKIKTAYRLKYAVFFVCLRVRLINCQSPRWYYHLSYNITPRTYFDAAFRLRLPAGKIFINAKKNNKARRFRRGEPFQGKITSCPFCPVN